MRKSHPSNFPALAWAPTKALQVMHGLITAQTLIARLGMQPACSVMIKNDSECVRQRACMHTRRRKFSRKNAAQRARRLMGQGLGHLVQRAPADAFRPAAGALRSEPWSARRGSPTYDPYGRALSHPAEQRMIPSDALAMAGHDAACNATLPSGVHDLRQMGANGWSSGACEESAAHVPSRPDLVPRTGTRRARAAAAPGGAAASGRRPSRSSSQNLKRPRRATAAAVQPAPLHTAPRTPAPPDGL